MNYTITQKDNGITEVVIPTDGEWGTICFAWEDSNAAFNTALIEKGLDTFIALLIADPNTAYSIFCGAE